MLIFLPAHPGRDRGDHYRDRRPKTSSTVRCGRLLARWGWEKDRHCTEADFEKLAFRLKVARTTARILVSKWKRGVI